MKNPQIGDVYLDEHNTAKRITNKLPRGIVAESYENPKGSFYRSFRQINKWWKIKSNNE